MFTKEQVSAIEGIPDGEYGYTELCKLTGIKKYSPNSNGQKTQINEIRRIRQIKEVDGVYRGRSITKYLIGEKLNYTPSSTPLDGKRGTKLSSEKKNMYFNLLEFLYSLATDEGCAEYSEYNECWKVTLTNNSIFKGLQLVNQSNYDLALCNSKQFCEYTGVNQDVLSEVMGAMTSNNAITINNMLQKLESLDLIYYVKTAIIGRNEIIIDDDGYELISGREIREASFGENTKIKKIKRTILNDMNMSDERDVHVKGERIKFYNKLRSKLQSEMGIDYYCPVYSISYDINIIIDFMEMLKNNPNIDLDSRKAANKFIENMKKNSKARKDRTLKSKSTKINPKKAARMLKCYDKDSETVFNTLHISSSNIPKVRKAI